MRTAEYYQKLDNGKVRCRLCPHDCLIYPNHVGICFVRQNQDGSLVPLTYGRVSSLQLDPIEKKPLYFFHPGTQILSIGSIGCNLTCFFCQNWQIAQPKDLIKKELLPSDPIEVVKRATQPLAVDDLVDLAKKEADNNSIGVAFTYNEPFIWFEYLLDATRALKKRGLKNVLVTNGFVNEEPLRDLLPSIDAMNIDIKGLSESFYRKVGGRLSPVLRTAEMARESCHIEITNLLIPGLNTDEKSIHDLVDWIADKLGQDTPLHLSRYFPARRLQTRPTSLAELDLAKKIALKRLKSVQIGNV
ncbi:MAG TPA: AmmeMemoRadiSam system radical SAM enzyme [Actinobacteria bacterium]|nr:AmmeMemoRadiSam system radical SAM enzyme [Actinomycetota bacterium]